MVAGVTGWTPSRSRDSSDSPAWVSVSSRGKARKPLVPLIVWIVRKMREISSRDVRLLLEVDEIPVHLVQVLVALHEEFADDLTKIFHGPTSWDCSQRAYRPRTNPFEKDRTEIDQGG